jgi:hypothetical protein
MTHISELVVQVHAAARRYRGCSPEQALVYSCEDIAGRECPSRELSRRDVEQLVAHICLTEDIDVPYIEFRNGRARCVAWSERSSRTIGFTGRTHSIHSVVHEIAHLSSHTDAHDAHFRSHMVRLARVHSGVEYAALLHSLFHGVGFTDPPWAV